MHLMCLLSGKVKIYKEGVGGRSQIIRVLKTKEYFAYRAFFAEGNFVTAASAFEPCTICLIPMPAIMKLIKDNSELALFFIRQLSIDLGISDERTVNLTQKHIRGRLRNLCYFYFSTKKTHKVHRSFSFAVYRLILFILLYRKVLSQELSLFLC